jgi:ferrous iron transport protein A
MKSNRICWTLNKNGANPLNLNHHASGSVAPHPSFPLIMAKEGEKVRIASMHRGKRFRERLVSIGIQVGNVIQLIQRREEGAVVISKENQRYVLGGGMALKILVTKEE